MKVTCHTNLDRYNNSHFPTDLPGIPRKGDKIMVKSEFVTVYTTESLPPILEVTNVLWAEDTVYLELWYNELDKKIADNAGARTM